MVRRVIVTGELSDSVTEAKGNRVLIARMKSVAIDLKPGDLSMGRLKVR